MERGDLFYISNFMLMGRFDSIVQYKKSSVCFLFKPATDIAAASVVQLLHPHATAHAVYIFRKLYACNSFFVV